MSDFAPLYEDLRHRAVDGESRGSGLALIQHRGLAAWMKAWASRARPLQRQPEGPRCEPGTSEKTQEMVQVLVAMALARREEVPA